jgi:hypothetical protein
MFKKSCIVCVLVWSILVLCSVWIFCRPSAQAREAYDLLMSLNDQAKKEQIKKQFQVTQQTRHHVSKQFLYKQNQQRLQSRLTSEQSELVFKQKGQETELKEHFKEMTCTMQEEFAYSKEETTGLGPQPQQWVRCLKAHEALYSYQSGQLEAENVELKRYLIPGHAWPSTIQTFHPLFQGSAQTIALSLLREPAFQAQRFQATFYSGENEW